VRGYHRLLKAALPGVWRIAASSLTRQKCEWDDQCRSTEYTQSSFLAIELIDETGLYTYLG
jgi:hypothetical protein